jgi:hypothetical protein
MTRLNVHFSVRQRLSLHAMARELGCTQAEVLRKALALLKVATDAQKEGCTLSVTKDGKVVKEIVGL